MIVISRTYGWVQNPSDFKKLKLVVQIFDNASTHYENLRDNLVPKFIYFENIRNDLLSKLTNCYEEFSYQDLVGTSKNKHGRSPITRAEAVADGLIQITILPQTSRTKDKFWTDNWTSDGYLRWALSLNFVKHNRDTDLCSITPLGKQLSRSIDDSEQEKDIFCESLLRYPPATQVLSILESATRPVSKFYIGNQLGFSGEKGFTSYDESLMFDWFINGTIEEQKKIKSDIEGTSDKYARMIASWLEKIGFVNKHSTVVDTVNGRKAGFQEFSITGRGRYALRRANGNSSNRRIAKYLTWEFLAVEGKNRNYVRSRRSYILKFLQETSSFGTLVEKLQQLGFNDDPVIIENDIQGLNNFGIRIEKDGSRVELKDLLVDFEIPDLDLTNELRDEASEQRKVEFMNRTDLPVKYIELLEIAFDGSRDRDFEIMTADIFKNIYGMQSVLLGGGRKPDCLVFCSDFGIIIDTKAYSAGYSKAISQEDEMVRYIEDNKYRDSTRNSIEWWNNFPSRIQDENFYFMWVSSKFIGRFHEQLESTYNRTNTKGGALNVEQLLLGANAVLRGELDVDSIPNFFNNNEIFWINS